MLTDQFFRLYSILKEHERKAAALFFKREAGEKELALFNELRKLKSRTSEQLAAKVYGDATKATSLRQLRRPVIEKLTKFIQHELLPSGKGASRIELDSHFNSLRFVLLLANSSSAYLLNHRFSLFRFIWSSLSCFH